MSFRRGITVARPRLLRDLACCLAVAATAAPLCASEATSRFHCQITGTESVPHLASDGGPAELTRFACSVRGGVLDGFRATGTNIWSGHRPRDRQLLGSLVVAHKAGAVVVYEVTRVTLQPGPPGDAGWEGRGSGIYKLATGPAVALAGRTFRSLARSAGPGAFTIETVVEVE